MRTFIKITNVTSYVTDHVTDEENLWNKEINLQQAKRRVGKESPNLGGEILPHDGPHGLHLCPLRHLYIYLSHLVNGRADTATNMFHPPRIANGPRNAGICLLLLLWSHPNLFHNHCYIFLLPSLIWWQCFCSISIISYQKKFWYNNTFVLPMA